MFKCILKRHEVMRDFCDFVECFRGTIDRTEVGYCQAFHKRLCANKLGLRIIPPHGAYSLRTNKGYLELAYAFKFPEKNEKTTGVDPWSMRQMAVYYQHNRITRRNTWILLNPTRKSPAWKKLESDFPDGIPAGTCQAKQNDVHRLLFSAYVGNWKPFLSCYEMEATQVVGLVQIIYPEN